MATKTAILPPKTADSISKTNALMPGSKTQKIGRQKSKICSPIASTAKRDLTAAHIYAKPTREEQLARKVANPSYS